MKFGRPPGVRHRRSDGIGEQCCPRNEHPTAYCGQPRSLPACAHLRHSRYTSPCRDSAHYRREADLNEVASGHGCLVHAILWSSGIPIKCGVLLAESHHLSCKSLIAKGSDSSSIAGRIGHLLQVAPIESAAARIFLRCARISARGTPDRALSVGSRTGAVFRRSGLSVAPRFLWECLTSQTVNPFPAPAASHPACRFPALGAPVCLVPRVMGPIGLGRLSRLTIDGAGSR